MTLLSVVQDVCNETGYVDAPSAVIGSTDKTVIQLKALAKKVGRLIRDKYPWRELQASSSITLVASTASYALPGAFNYELAQTFWNTTDDWRVYGPVGADEWNDITVNSTVTNNDRYRIKGLTSSQLFIYPTPGTADAGEAITFEYLSLNCWRPATYATATVYANGSYCFYNGIIYYAATGGTSSGATPAADTGITWAAYTDEYSAPLADTDVFVLGEDMLTMGMKAYFRQQNRYEGFAEDLNEFWVEVGDRFGRRSGAAPTALSRGGQEWPNVADTGIMSYSED